MDNLYVHEGLDSVIVPDKSAFFDAINFDELTVLTKEFEEKNRFRINRYLNELELEERVLFLEHFKDLDERYLFEYERNLSTYFTTKKASSTEAFTINKKIISVHQEMYSLKKIEKEKLQRSLLLGINIAAINDTKKYLEYSKELLKYEKHPGHQIDLEFNLILYSDETIEKKQERIDNAIEIAQTEPRLAITLAENYARVVYNDRFRRTQLPYEMKIEFRDLATRMYDDLYRLLENKKYKEKADSMRNIK